MTHSGSSVFEFVINLKIARALGYAEVNNAAHALGGLRGVASSR
jgi:hypothetical protein